VALVATQVGLLSTSLSLPMLAPLLLGTGMLLRSIRTNASLVFPRIGLLVVLLWLLWFANSVVQNTVAYLRKQGALDPRLANNINSAAELASLLTAAVILLSMLGVNVSALLLPAGVALALAAKDLSHNFLAGFFLMMVQPFRWAAAAGGGSAPGAASGPARRRQGPAHVAPCRPLQPHALTAHTTPRVHTHSEFLPNPNPTPLRRLFPRLGDRVGVTLPGGSPGGFGASGSWFEGVCEKMDLRWAGQGGLLRPGLSSRRWRASAAGGCCCACAWHPPFLPRPLALGLQPPSDGQHAACRSRVPAPHPHRLPQHQQRAGWPRAGTLLCARASAA
jgi:hypothetical protein